MFTVVYDACVLYPAPLRDLLLRIAVTGLVRARWTEEILDECFGNILRNRPDLDPARLDRTRQLMNEAVPDSLITGYEDLIPGLSLPDEDDRHVLAAAIRGGAQSIISSNLRDFPGEALGPYGIEALSPDEFIQDMLDLNPQLVVQALEAQARSLRNPKRTVAELLNRLEDASLRSSVNELREYIGMHPLSKSQMQGPSTSET